MQPLYAFGDLVLDVVARVESGLDRDTDTPGEVRSAPGGSAANFAVWTRRLGDPVRFASRVGNDLLGRALHDDMRQEGIETEIAVDPVHPTAVLVLFSSGSQRHMMVPRGAHHFLDAGDILAESVRTAGWLHVTGYSFFWDGPGRAAWKAIGLAREAGVPISFDPSSAGFIRRQGLPAIPGLKLLMPNKDEALTMTGLDEVEAAAAQLAKQAEIVAVKLGPEGALLAYEGKQVHVPPAALTGEAVDATGAGDAWGAAFIHGLRTGLEPVEAARRANRLGAAIVTQIGARPALTLPLD